MKLMPALTSFTQFFTFDLLSVTLTLKLFKWELRMTTSIQGLLIAFVQSIPKIALFKQIKGLQNANYFFQNSNS